MSFDSKEHYSTVEDLLADETFGSYCMGLDDQIVEAWQEWIRKNPEKIFLLDEARRIYFILNGQNTREQFERDFHHFKMKTQQITPAVPQVTVKSTKLVSLKRTIQFAAAALALLLAGWYFLSTVLNQNTQQVTADAAAEEQKNFADVQPGGNRATLTLADGTIIVLDSLTKGAVSTQGSVQVVKPEDGELAYEVIGNSQQGAQGYHVISTPRGGQYQVVLADGSRVWLNAASSLRYPSSFGHGKRKVELTGEGYFEIAHNADQPFIVTVNGMDVEVLGTSFNINAYSDEDDIRTTLVEGKVLVHAGKHRRSLVPGEQLRYKGDHLNVMESVDVAAVTAWKNGYFDLNGLSLQQMLRQISRWYNVDVRYEGTVPPFEFGGKLQRSLPFSKVVEILKMSNVNVDVSDEKVIVIKP